MKHPLLLELLSKFLPEGVTDRRNLTEEQLGNDSYYFGRFIADIEQPTLLGDTIWRGKGYQPKAEELGLPNELSKFIQSHNHKVKQINVVYERDLRCLTYQIGDLFSAVRDVDRRSDGLKVKQQLADFKQRWPFVASIVESYFDVYTSKLTLPISINVDEADDYTVQLDQKLLSKRRLKNETDELFNERMAFRDGHFLKKELLDNLDEDYKMIRCSVPITDTEYQLNYYRQNGRYDNDRDNGHFPINYGYNADEWFFEWLIEFLNVEIGGDSTVLRQKFDWLIRDQDIGY